RGNVGLSRNHDQMIRERYTPSRQIHRFRSLLDQDRLVRAHIIEKATTTEPVASLGIAVQGEDVVIVANGADGIVVWDASGAWARLGLTMAGFNAASAVSLAAPGRYPDDVPQAAVLAAVAAGLVALGCGVRKLRFILAAALVWLGVRSYYQGVNTPILFDPYALLLALVLVFAGVSIMIASAILGEVKLRVSGIALATAIAVYYSVMTPFYAWSAGHLDYYSVATELAIGLGAVTALAGSAVVITTSISPRRSFPGRTASTAD
ncbi:hypothetical protein, partial [Thermocatellispora tengchongensis]